MQRETCLFCVIKHITQAMVLLVECKQGYKIHKWFAVGHLAEAETESIEQYPELSERIRKVRIEIMGQDCEVREPSLVPLIRDIAELIENK